MSKPKNKTMPVKGQNKPSPAASVELVAVPTAPRRDGFSIADYRSTIKSAENVDNPTRTKLYDYYNDILLDLHLTAVIDKRRDNIRSTKFAFVADKGKFNESIDNLMSSPWWRQMLSDLLDARFFGYTAAWLDLSGGQFHKYALLPRKHVVPEKGLFLTKQADRNGISFVDDPKYQPYTVTAGQTHDLGLLLKAIPWVLYKRGNISDQATFLELFAMPFRLGKYPDHDMQAKKALGEALRDAAAMGFAAIPDSTKLEFIQNQASGNGSAYERFAMFCDKQISKGFLHNTMTLDAEGGQYKGDIHGDSERGTFASDRQFVLDILNTQILHLLEVHGFSPGGGYFDLENEDHICLTDRIGIDMQINDIVEIPPEHWYTKYNIPMPEGGAKAKSPAVTPQQLSAISARMAALDAQLRNMTESQPLDIDPPQRRFFD